MYQKLLLFINYVYFLHIILITVLISHNDLATWCCVSMWVCIVCRSPHTRLLCPELISKLNFLDEDEQEQNLTSSNPFEEPDDPVDLNPFTDPDEEGKGWPLTLCMTLGFKSSSKKKKAYRVREECS